MAKEKEEIFDIPDFGNFDFDLDIGDFDLDTSEIADDNNRYIKPRLVPMRESQILYDNALALARHIQITKQDRYDCIVSGSFIFGDFIEAFLTLNNCKAKNMVITTLSMSQENVDSLATLLQKGYIDKLDLLVSDYFFSHERHGLIPYIYKELDFDNKVQLSVAFVHTKTVHFETLGGKKIVIHGSANLRTSGNVEQFTIEENSELYDFYEQTFRPVIDRFLTINKTAPRKTPWADMINKKFNN